MTDLFQSRTESTRDDWMTPLHIPQELGAFDLDPCANCEQPTRLASKGYTLADDGLAQTWQGRVWLNPPYGSAAETWMLRLARHGNGIALIAPRVDARWFHDVVFKAASAIFFVRGRLAFINPLNGEQIKGNNAGSCLVAYGAENAAALRHTKLPGQFINLN